MAWQSPPVSPTANALEPLDEEADVIEVDYGERGVMRGRPRPKQPTPQQVADHELPFQGLVSGLYSGTEYV